MLPGAVRPYVQSRNRQLRPCLNTTRGPPQLSNIHNTRPATTSPDARTTGPANFEHRRQRIRGAWAPRLQILHVIAKIAYTEWGMPIRFAASVNRRHEHLRGGNEPHERLLQLIEHPGGSTVDRKPACAEAKGAFEDACAKEVRRYTSCGVTSAPLLPPERSAWYPRDGAVASGLQAAATAIFGRSAFSESRLTIHSAQALADRSHRYGE